MDHSVWGLRFQKTCIRMSRALIVIKIQKQPSNKTLNWTKMNTIIKMIKYKLKRSYKVGSGMSRCPVKCIKFLRKLFSSTFYSALYRKKQALLAGFPFFCQSKQTGQKSFTEVLQKHEILKCTIWPSTLDAKFWRYFQKLRFTKKKVEVRKWSSWWTLFKCLALYPK